MKIRGRKRFKKRKVRLILTLSLSPCVSVLLIFSSLSFLSVWVCVWVCVFYKVFVCVLRTETDKARGSEWERERKVWKKWEEGDIRKREEDGGRLCLRACARASAWWCSGLHVCIKKWIGHWTSACDFSRVSNSCLHVDGINRSTYQGREDRKCLLFKDESDVTSSSGGTSGSFC